MRLILVLANLVAIQAFTPSLSLSHLPHITSGKLSFSSTQNAIVSSNNRVTRRTSLRSAPPKDASTDESFNKAPTFNGQLILPIKVIMNGLKSHKVAAVYAIQSEKQTPAGSAWGAVKHISITKDLYSDLEALLETYGKEQVKFVRALSFAYPQKAAMTEVGQRWAGMVMQDGGVMGLTEFEKDESEIAERTAEEKEELVKLMMATADYDDDDDDDEFEFDDDDDGVPLFVDQTQSSEPDADADADAESETESNEVTSPFEKPTYSSTSDEKLEFNRETVDKVLDEIRPYLISDGGNVSVHSVDEETRSVYLVLEGACGSCASSTVTMQMGIERVLKENFDNMGEVAQVQPEELDGGSDENATELTMDAVMREVNRIKPAITAMGGNVEVLNVDPLGVVEVRFRGANKVQQGLELALLDVKYVKHVKFVN